MHYIVIFGIIKQEEMATNVVIYNTLTRTKEKFVPLKDKKINMFVCGQTVYDDAHIGHARTYIAFDVIVRWLRFLGYDVKYIQNITDVDDKIITRAKEKNTDAVDLARLYEKRFMEDMEALGVRRNVDAYPRSHDYIEAIEKQIQLLLDNGYAYILDGDVYYDVSKFKDYRKLSGIRMEALNKHRIEPKEGKRNSYDFALWKTAKPGEPAWEIEAKVDGASRRLNGRPGWHIEDTAIAFSFFGPQYDVHGGASELIFPHHTNEIAQAEAAFGIKPFVRYWLHSGVLNIRGEKMSKSLKNFITIREALKKYPKEVLRLFVCSTHYRKEINYTEELMKNANKLSLYMHQSLSLFYNMREDEQGKSDRLLQAVEDFGVESNKAMNNDFNTPLALTRFLSILREIRRFVETNDSITANSKRSVMNKMIAFGNILGILNEQVYKEKLPKGVEKLIKEREELRKAGKYDAADEIRTDIETRYHIKIEDTEYGTLWHK